MHPVEIVKIFFNDDGNSDYRLPKGRLKIVSACSNYLYGDEYIHIPHLKDMFRYYPENSSFTTGGKRSKRLAIWFERNQARTKSLKNDCYIIKARNWNDHPRAIFFESRADLLVFGLILGELRIDFPEMFEADSGND